MLVLFGCNHDDRAKEYVPCHVYYPSSNNVTYKSEAELPEDIYIRAPGMSERTSWNIELLFYSQKNKELSIVIIDHDNQGFAMNDSYFILEAMEEDQWKVIFASDEVDSYNNLTYYAPHSDAFAIKSVLQLEGNPIFGGEIEKYLRKGVLGDGLYRMTKIISGRPMYAVFRIGKAGNGT